jgi:hypothetical protein
MELALNLAWVLLAALMFCLWWRYAPQTGRDRRMQLVALAVLLLVLFPVISVTDDLQAAQNPAETNSCQRRVHGYTGPHSNSSPIAALPLTAFAGLSLGSPRVATPGNSATPVIDHPALHPIQNRPPPAA